MPRQPRHFVAGMPQHLIARGVNRQAVFFQPRDYDRYLQSLQEASDRYGCAIHAYVLMTNHVHLLVTPNTARSVPLMMQAMGTLYVQHVNKLHGRTGTLWEGRYKASLVQDDLYLLTCQRYIEMNPVRGGLARRPGEYPYSSYACNALGRLDALVKPHPVYLDLHPSPASRRAAYRQMFRDELSDEALKTVRDATNAGLVIGNERFKDEIALVLGRSVRPGRSGRPTK